MQHRRCKGLTPVFHMLGESGDRHFVPVRRTVDSYRHRVSSSSTTLVDSAPTQSSRDAISIENTNRCHECRNWNCCSWAPLKIPSEAENLANLQDFRQCPKHWFDSENMERASLKSHFKLASISNVWPRRLRISERTRNVDNEVAELCCINEGVCLLHEVRCRFYVPWSQRRCPHRPFSFWTSSTDSARNIFEISNKIREPSDRHIIPVIWPETQDFLWCFATQPDVLSRGQPSFDGSGNKWRCFHWNWSLAVRSTLSSVV